MVGLIDRLKPKDKLPPAAKDTAASKQPDEATKKAEELIQKQLHAKPEELGKSYQFTKLTTSGDQKTKAILDRFEITDKATEYDNAVLSKDGNTLVVVNRGEVALKQLFGGANGFSRFMYKVFGWLPRLFGSPHKAELANKYKELFSGEGIDMQHEPIGHMFSALKSGEYHTVSIFQKDTTTGEFTKQPAAVAIIDAYENLIESNIRREMEERSLPDKAIDKEVEARKAQYKDYYAGDKMIPLSPQASMSDLFHQMVEGLYAAQGFKAFVVPSQVHANPNVDSNDLNYQELDWHMISQNKDMQWQVMGDPKVLDKIPSLADEEKTEYKSKLTASPFSPKVTIVRPKDQADKAIPPFLAYLQQWSAMSQGAGLRTTNKEDLDLIELTEPVNAGIIQNHNSQMQVASSLIEGLEAPWKEREDPKEPEN